MGVEVKDPEGRALLRRLFFTAVILALAYDLVGIFSDLYLRPVLVGWLSTLIPPGADQLGFAQNFDAQSFYSNVIQNLIGFAVSPVIFLYVFYRMGSKSWARLESSHIGLLKYSFLGGLVGYTLGYFVTVGIIWAAQGGFSMGSSWFVYVPQLVISVAREAVLMVLFAFTGVYLGYLRARRRSDEVRTVSTQS